MGLLGTCVRTARLREQTTQKSQITLTPFILVSRSISFLGGFVAASARPGAYSKILIPCSTSSCFLFVWLSVVLYADFTEMMRALGYPRSVSMDNFRSPNFQLVADALFWMVKRYDPDIAVSDNIESENDRVDFLTGVATVGTVWQRPHRLTRLLELVLAVVVAGDGVGGGVRCRFSLVSLFFLQRPWLMFCFSKRRRFDGVCFTLPGMIFVSASRFVGRGCSCQLLASIARVPLLCCSYVVLLVHSVDTSRLSHTCTCRRC